MFSGDGGSYLEIYITFQRIKILAYVLPSSITNEREDILKFFLFINIYGGINAFYYFFLFPEEFVFKVISKDAKSDFPEA